MRTFAFSLALALASLSTGAQAAVQVQATLPCLTPPEAEALLSAVAPDALRATGLACAAALPAGALVRQTSGPLLDAYQAEADRAWPRASGTIAKLIGGQVSGLTDSQLLRPMLTTLLVPLIVAGVKPKDCAAIDRIVTLMAPLPPRNTAALFVTVYQLSQPTAARKSPLKLCPAPAR